MVQHVKVLVKMLNLRLIKMQMLPPCVKIIKPHILVILVLFLVCIMCTVYKI